MNGSLRRLSELNINEEATICGFAESCEIKRRLYELGFVPGSKVVCTLVSPLGDPKAFLIKDTTIAIRSDDSGKIEIF